MVAECVIEFMLLIRYVHTKYNIVLLMQISGFPQSSVFLIHPCVGFKLA